MKKIKEVIVVEGRYDKNTLSQVVDATIVETGEDGVTYDILYDILIKQNGDLHSDWTNVPLDVEKYRRVVFEPYDLKVLDGTVDF